MKITVGVDVSVEGQTVKVEREVTLTREQMWRAASEFLDGSRIEIVSRAGTLSASVIATGCRVTGCRVTSISTEHGTNKNDVRLAALECEWSQTQQAPWQRLWR